MDYFFDEGTAPTSIHFTDKDVNSFIMTEIITYNNNNKDVLYNINNITSENLNKVEINVYHRHNC